MDLSKFDDYFLGEIDYGYYKFNKDKSQKPIKNKESIVNIIIIELDYSKATKQQLMKILSERYNIDEHRISTKGKWELVDILKYT